MAESCRCTRALVDSFRSICVTSVVTRCCQAVLREKILTGIRPHLAEFLVGVFVDLALAASPFPMPEVLPPS